MADIRPFRQTKRLRSLDEFDHKPFKIELSSAKDMNAILLLTGTVILGIVIGLLLPVL